MGNKKISLMLVAFLILSHALKSYGQVRIKTDTNNVFISDTLKIGIHNLKKC